jgi:predicted GNAT superfamily acetyltransferase
VSAAPPYAESPGRVRAFTDSDLDDVLALNQLEVDKLAPLDEATLGRIRSVADRVDVVELDGAFAGFVITLGPGTDYWSDNYRWYTERFGGRFYYLDRVVLHERTRGTGLGRQLYDGLEAHAAPYGRLALEVNAAPPNPVSMRFHLGRGYQQLDERELDPDHRVAMLVKELR